MITNVECLDVTKRIIGSDAIDKVGSFLKADGAHIVLLHYGKGEYLNAVLPRIKASLSAAGLGFVELGGVVPNPRLGLVEEGIKFARENNVDYILSVGGGSAVDSAKGIAQGMAYEGELWKLWQKTDAIPADVKVTPVSTVVTYPATGADCGAASVVCNEETREKYWSWDMRAQPHYAFMDPEYTMSLPRYLLCNGIGDMMTHYTDSYLAPNAHFGLYSNLLESIMHYIHADLAPIILDPERDNLVDRTELMVATSLACDATLNLGHDGENASHQLAHAVGAIYDTTHGSALSIIYRAWLEYICEDNIPRFARMAEKVWGVEPNPSDERAVAYEGINRLINWFASLGLPVKFSDEGLCPTEEEIELMADQVVRVFGTGYIGKNRKLYKDDVVQIYKNSL